MIKYEQKKWFDSFDTDNYTEDKKAGFSFEITEEKAEQFAKMWLEMGATHYETSKAHFYEITTDSTHYTQYILYK